MMGPAWLPADDDHPPRPDWPIFRHLTFTELHALELGVGMAILVWWARVLGVQGAVFPLALYVARVILGKRREEGDTTPATHTVGLHDIRQAPPYFVVAAIVTITLLLVGAWGYTALAA